MENIDSSITKIYEKQQTSSGTEEEALEYLQVLEQHNELNVIIEEQTDTPIKISRKSWDNIIKLMPEEKKYSLAYICFSLVNEIEENEIWGIRKNAVSGEETVLQDVFFNIDLEASTPHDLPFEMCEDDFSQFTDYFNQKEKEAKDRKIKLSEDFGMEKGKKEGESPPEEDLAKEEKDKDEEKKDDEGYEVKTEVIEDKNGVTRLVTTKTTTSKVTVYEPKISLDANKDGIEKKEEKEIKIEKPKDENLRSKLKPKEGKPKEKDKQKLEISKPVEEVIKEVVKSGFDFEGEPQAKISRKIIITRDGKEQTFEEEEVPNEEIKYKIIISGTAKNPKSKVIRKKKVMKDGKEGESEEEVPREEILFKSVKPDGKPKIRTIRKKFIVKGGKEEEVEEDPGKQVIYKTVSYENEMNKEPQIKIIRKRFVTKNNKTEEIEEDIPGDQLLYKVTRYGEQGKPKTIILRKIIILKNGKIQEIEEEVPGDDTIYKAFKYEKGEPKTKLIKDIIEIGKPEEVKELQKVEGELAPEEEVVYKTIKYGEEGKPQTKVIKKKIINIDGKKQEIEEEVPIEEIKEYLEKEPKAEAKIKEPKEIEIEEIPSEQIIYKVIKLGNQRNPQTKVIKKTKIVKFGRERDNEEPVPNEEILYEPTKYDENEKPTTKIIRKRIILKDGKKEEVEEEPGKHVIYKTVKCGPSRTLQTKIIRKRTITKDGKDKETEEDMPGDELIVKKINITIFIKSTICQG